MQEPPRIPDPQVLQDAEHIKALAIAHYVLGVITGLFACFPLIHMAIGGMMVMKKFPVSPTGPPIPQEAQMFGWVFLILGGVMVLAGWAVAISMLLTGRWLSARKNHTFCFVVGCIECLFMPLGTILGVFSLVVLMRPTVKALFQAPSEAGIWSQR